MLDIIWLHITNIGSGGANVRAKGCSILVPGEPMLVGWPVILVPGEPMLVGWPVILVPGEPDGAPRGAVVRTMARLINTVF